VAIYYFPRFGKLCQEKSGNPVYIELRYRRRASISQFYRIGCRTQPSLPANPAAATAAISERQRAAELFKQRLQAQPSGAYLHAHGVPF
jgi:hypothetical protein